MSYCRVSDECYLSDVYVYESREGFVIHVASHRYHSDQSRPKKPQTNNVDEVIAYHQACADWALRATTKPIGLPHDGETHTLASAKECAEKLLELREVGYYVPQYAVDALMEESEVIMEEQAKYDAGEYSPGAFLQKMRELNEISDTPNRHLEMDELMCETLHALGYGEGVAIYRKAQKWYE